MRTNRRWRPSNSPMVISPCTWARAPAGSRSVGATSNCPDGTIVRVYTAGAPYYTDNHELVGTMTGDGVTAAHLFGYDLRTVDLTALGGRPDQLVAGHAILRQSASGVTEFLWNAWDHFSLTDW